MTLESAVEQLASCSKIAKHLNMKYVDETKR